MSDLISHLTDPFENISKTLLIEFKAKARFEIPIETRWAIWRLFLLIRDLGGWFVTQSIHIVDEFLSVPRSKIVVALICRSLWPDRNCYEWDSRLGRDIPRGCSLRRQLRPPQKVRSAQ